MKKFQILVEVCVPTLHNIDSFMLARALSKILYKLVEENMIWSYVKSCSQNFKNIN